MINHEHPIYQKNDIIYLIDIFGNFIVFRRYVVRGLM